MEIQPIQKSQNLFFLVVVYIDGWVFLSFFQILFIDENECEISNVGCQHECENINGSFICHCNEGFFLDGNGKTCSGKHEIKEIASKHLLVILVSSLLFANFCGANYFFKVKNTLIYLSMLITS